MVKDRNQYFSYPEIGQKQPPKYGTIQVWLSFMSSVVIEHATKYNDCWHSVTYVIIDELN